MSKNLFLDFETNTAGDFYVAGYFFGGKFSQVVLTPALDGLASEKNLPKFTPKDFCLEILKNINREEGLILAYSNAELETILNIFDGSEDILIGVRYCNLAKAGRSWVSKYQSEKFDNLPPLVIGANSYYQKRHRRSLASISRLIDFPAPADYAIGKTTSRFNSVINALKLREQDFKKLTAVQKAKATKALKHNRYDVEAIVRLYEVIIREDPGIIKRATRKIVN